jgi:hypothetical protein
VTATCRHCGLVLSGPEDGLLDKKRELRKRAYLHNKIVDHMVEKHNDEAQQATRMGVEFLGWCYLVQFSSTDAQFNQWVEEVRKKVEEQVKPKEGGSPLAG